MNLIFVLLSIMMHENLAPRETYPSVQDKPLFSFGVVADVQYAAQETAGSRYYGLSVNRLREAYEAFSSYPVSFVINLGDLIDNDISSYTPVISIMDSSGLKTWHVAGNHDYAVASNRKKKLPVVHGKGYYSFSQQGYRFIFLNGNEISIYAGGSKSEVARSREYLESLKSAGAINAVEWNGGISKAQMEWLKKELDDASEKNEKTFISCHFPIYPENVHNLLNYRDVLELTSNYRNIIAWFNGHNHAGNYGNFNMIHFITFRGMVETGSSGSFAIIDVYRNKIWIRGFGREKNMVLAY